MKTWEKGCLFGLLGCGGLSVIVLGTCTYIAGSAVRRGEQLAKANPKAAPAAQASAEPSKPKTAWSYSEQKDPMGHGTERTATVDSVLPMELGFPYQGIQFPHLELRDRGGQKDLYLYIDKGQFHTGYPEGHIEIRFDDAPAMRVGVGQPADGSSTILFLRSYNSLVPKILKAKRVRIKAEMYQNGGQVMEFPVEGLDWKL